MPPDMAVVTDQAAGAAGMTLVERPEPPAAITMSSFRFMRLGSCRLRWDGPRPGPIAPTVTAGRRSLAMSWPGWSPRSAMARRACRWGSGCSASQTGIVMGPWPSVFGVRSGLALRDARDAAAPRLGDSARSSESACSRDNCVGSAIAARRPDGIAGTRGAPVSATQAIARGAEARSRWLPFHADSAHGRLRPAEPDAYFNRLTRVSHL